MRKKLIKVTFPDGKIICYKSRTETMLSVLREIEEWKYEDIKIKWKHLPLVSVNNYLRYEEWMRPICPGWYLNTKSTPNDKYLQLKEISRQLGLNLIVDFDYGFTAQDEDKGAKPKDEKMLVRFSNGEYIGNKSATDTFLEVVWNLGVDEIMRRELTWNEKSLITKSKLYKGQIQIDKDRWIVCPRTTREKVKMLRVLSAMLHIKFDVNLI